MRRTWTVPCLICLMLTACGDDDGGNQNLNNQSDAAVQQDVQVVPDGQVGPDAEVIPPHACTGEPIAEPGPAGSCCNVDADCLDGRCIVGWCSLNCSDDSDCPVTAPGPFPTGTQMRCNYNELGNYFRWCVPGSLQDCGQPGDAQCPAGEVCWMGWNDNATEFTSILRGICMTAMAYEGVQTAGGFCEESTGVWPTQCEAPGYFVVGCFSRRCSEACDPTSATETCPTGTFCQDYLALASSSGVLSGVGVCAPSTCGEAFFTGDDSQDLRLPGVDGDCPSGEHCSFQGLAYGQNGDRLLWHCEQDIASLGQTGYPCEQAAKFDLPCDNTMFCIQKAAELDRFGAVCEVDEDCGAEEVCVAPNIGSSHCSPKPDPGVCSLSCRTDADCPSLGGVPSHCIEQRWNMPNGESGFITFCLSETFLTPETIVPCDLNSDCDTDVGEACAGLSARSDFKFCIPVVPQDSQGTDCSVGGVADCQAGEVCVENETEGTFLCSPYLEVGESCDATPEICLGVCEDIDLEPYDDTAPNNVFCANHCTSNADCGPSQVCDYRFGAENDPASRADDVGQLVCRTMTVKSGSGCAVPGDCTNGNACHVATGRCYTSTAAWGDPCTDHSDCPAYGLCDTRVQGGLCYRPGCDPASGNAGCDGTGACSGFLPIGMCLENCTTTGDCSRSGAGFTCESGACIAP